MKRCPFPNCVLDEEHDGDHDFARPARPCGILRVTQEFCSVMANSPRCDLEDFPGQHPRARALLIDELGFGWALCTSCVAKFPRTGESETIDAEVPQAESCEAPRAPAPRRSEASPAKSRVARDNVISFAARERGIR